MSAAVLVSMALCISADSSDGGRADLANNTAAMIDEYGLIAVLDALREAADSAIDAHDDDPLAAGIVDRLRTFSTAIATARGAVS